MEQWEFEVTSGGRVRFRTDLPADWLVHASIARIHACNDGVRAGRIDPGDALRILTTSVRDLFTGASAVPAPSAVRRRAAVASVPADLPKY